jgi:hypothetical protein
MFCKSCGKQIDEDSIFCSFCGVSQSKANRPVIDSVSIQDNNPLRASTESDIIKPSAEEFNKQQHITKPNQYINRKVKYQDEAIFIGVLLIFSTIIASIYYQEYYQLLLALSIIIKILLTFWIVDFASKLNRNKVLWGIFGFFMTGLALIIIGLLRRKEIYYPQSATTNHYKPSVQAETVYIKLWDCPSCNNPNPNTTFICQKCGYNLK